MTTSQFSRRVCMLLFAPQVSIFIKGFMLVSIGLNLSLLQVQAELPKPYFSFISPKVLHYTYHYNNPLFGYYHLDQVRLILQHPDGHAEVILDGDYKIGCTNRLADLTAGTYTFSLHEVFGYGYGDNTTTNHVTTTLVQFTSGTLMSGTMLFAESFDNLNLKAAEVTIPNGLSLTLNKVKVNQDITVNAGGLFQMTESEIGGNVIAGNMTPSSGPIKLDRCYVTNSIQVTSTKGQPAKIDRCQAGVFIGAGDTILLSGCTSGTGAQIEAQNIDISGSYFARSRGSILHAKTALHLQDNDFYENEALDDVERNLLNLGCPPKGLSVVHNVFILPVAYRELSLSGSEGLIIANNSFLNQVALIIQRSPSDYSLREKYNLSGNYWGQYLGTYWPGREDSFGWLASSGGHCLGISTKSTWLNQGPEQVSNLVTSTPPAIMLFSKAVGQNVLSPTYSYVRKGRDILVSYDLITLYGTQDRNQFYLQIGNEKLSPEPGRNIERDYGDPNTATTDPGRTLNFIIKASNQGQIDYALIQQRPEGATQVDRGTITQADPPSRPLRIGVKLMSINAWGFGNSFKYFDTFTQVSQELEQAIPALLPLKRRADFRLISLGSASYTPWFTGLFPYLRDYGMYRGLASALVSELDMENARRIGQGQPILDFILGVLPDGNISKVGGGATGFNYACYARAPVVEEIDPRSVIHEIGHGLGLYQAKEQYDLTDGWNTVGWSGLGLEQQVFIDTGFGARAWGETLFIPEEDIRYGPIGGRIRHLPAGVPPGIYDIMGGKSADVIIPSTHERYVNALRWLLGTATPLSQQVASASLKPAPNTRRLLVEAFAVYMTNSSIFAILPETVTCRLAPEDMASITSPGQAMPAVLKAFDAKGALLGSWPCKHAILADVLFLKWIQTFDVPESTTRLEIEQDRIHSTLFVNSASQAWSIRLLGVPSGLSEGVPLGSQLETGNIIGNYIDLNFVVEGQTSAGRPLGITLCQSTNQGAVWNYIGQYDESTSVRLPGDTLPISDNLLFKAIISDGFQNQESIIGPYRNLAIKPRVSVVHPWPGATAPTNTAWTMEAQVYSARDITNVVWTSSISGMLGSQALLTDMQLTPGSHRLTCTVTDSSGLTNSAAVNVMVVEPQVIDLLIETNALSLFSSGADSSLNKVSRPQTGKPCVAEVILRNPGATNRIRARLYHQAPGQPEVLLKEETFDWKPLQSHVISGRFQSNTRGTNSIRAMVEFIGPDTLSETNLLNNSYTWSFQNMEPIGLGGRGVLYGGKSMEVLLNGWDPDGDALTFEVARQPAHGILKGLAPNLTYQSDTNYAGIDSLAFRVSDGDHRSSEAEFIFKVMSTLPELPSSLAITSKLNQPFLFRLPATGQNLQYSSPDLRTKFNFIMLDSLTGILSGTPRTVSTQTVTIIAENSVGRSSGQLRLSFIPNLDPPVITSSQSATGRVSNAFSYAIQAQNGVLQYRAQALPSGLTINEFTGIISGIPLASGMFTVSIGATNANGMRWATLSLRILPNAQPPAFPAKLTTSATLGQPFRFSLADFCANDPYRFTMTGLPADLKFDENTGIISGVPMMGGGGTFVLPVTALNLYGQTNTILWLEVKNVPGVPFIEYINRITVPLNQDFRYQIQASLTPTNYWAMGLPEGLMVDAKTGLITGKASRTGQYNTYLLAANNAGPNGIKVLFVVAAPTGSPNINSSLLQIATLGLPYRYTITANNAAAGFRATGLTPGLVVDSASGIISGRPERTGQFDVSLFATNAAGLGEALMKLQVYPDFAGWLAVQGLSGLEAGPEADLDHDALSNLAEYAFQGNPRQGLDSERPRLERRDNRLWLTYRVWAGGTGNLLSAYQTGGIRYILETSDNPEKSWTQNLDQFDFHIQITDHADGTQTLDIPLIFEVTAKPRFYRVRIEKQ